MHHHIESLQLGKACLNCSLICVVREKDQAGSIADCVAAGFDRDVARKVEHLIYISEYKRFQSAPGARLSKGAFWVDRRYRIVNRWRDPS